MINAERHNTFEIFFFRSVLIILAITATAKIKSTLGTAAILSVTNDVLPISNRRLMQGGAVAELIVLLVLLFSGNRATKLFTLGWLCALLIVYRVGSAIYGRTDWCPCFGTITSNIGISPATANIVMSLVLGYIFIGWLVLTAKSCRLTNRTSSSYLSNT